MIVSADLTGDGEIMVTEFQINGMDMEGTLEGNRLTYMMEPPLVAAADSILRRGSDNTISIKIVDSQGLTAEGASKFRGLLRGSNGVNHIAACRTGCRPEATVDCQCRPYR